MPKTILNDAAIQKIINETQKFEIQKITSQEWSELLNENNSSSIELLKSVLEDITNPENSSNRSPLSKTNALISSTEPIEIQSFQDDLVKILTEIRIKNHILQHPEQFSEYLGGKTPQERVNKLEEFEFWRKMNTALSKTGDKQLEMVAQVLETTPTSLESELSDIKKTILAHYQTEQKSEEKKKDILTANTDQIIQQIIKYRDEKSQEFNKFLEQIRKEIKPNEEFIGLYINLMTNLKEHEKLTKNRRGGYKIRARLIELNDKINEDFRLFDKNPLAFVDPLNELSIKERNLKVLGVFKNLSEYREETLRDNEDYAIARTREVIQELEKQIKGLETKSETTNAEATESARTDLIAILELEKRELEYLPIQKAVRQNLDNYIYAYNQLGQTTTSQAELEKLPIPINEANQAFIKTALNEFASEDESGQFSKSVLLKSTEYRKTIDFSKETLALIEEIKKEYPEEAQKILNSKSTVAQQEAPKPTVARQDTPEPKVEPQETPRPTVDQTRITSVQNTSEQPSSYISPPLAIPQKVLNTRQIQQEQARSNHDLIKRSQIHKTDEFAETLTQSSSNTVKMTPDKK